MPRKKRTPDQRPEGVVLTSQLRQQLPAVLSAVQRGQEFTLRHYATDVARIVPLTTAPKETPMRPTMTVLATYNQAGGSGKTSLTRDLGYALATRGHRVLLIDADPQASLTRWLGLFQTPEDGSVPTALSVQATIRQVLDETADTLPQPIPAFDMDVIPSNRHLKGAELYLSGQLPEEQGRLRRAIQALSDRYDYVLIDTPPADNALVLACIAASDLMIMPVTGSKGLDNIDNVSRVIRQARAINPGLNFGLFVVTGYNKNLLHDAEVYDALTQVYADLGPTAPPIAFRPGIYKDAPNAMQPVAVYRPKSPAVQEIDAVTDAVVHAAARQAQLVAP